mgnify:CR=1 FL=1
MAFATVALDLALTTLVPGAGEAMAVIAVEEALMTVVEEAKLTPPVGAVDAPSCMSLATNVAAARSTC